MIEIKDIKKLAELSRISISQDEKEIFLKDIGSILNYVDQIKKVVGTQEATAPREEGELVNIFREDEHYHDSGLFTKDLLESAPEKKDGYIKVKKIL